MKVLAIDQSMNGSAVCVLNDGEITQIETWRYTAADGLSRLCKIRDRLKAVLDKCAPDVVAMEDYARQIRSASITKLVELGGVIKALMVDCGFSTSTTDCSEGKKTFIVQNESTMKKYCLGHGGTGKDTGYLMKVFEATKRRFEDDNQADAYMHAYMASQTASILRGSMSIGNLLNYQQECLIKHGLPLEPNKKGKMRPISLTRAMKMPDADKQLMVRINQED